MGEYADMEIERQLSNVFGDLESPHKKSWFPFGRKKSVLDRRNFLWTDKSGNKYRMNQITDSHLVNIIRFLRRGDGVVSPNVKREDLIKFLEEEAISIRHIKEMK